ncbi:phage tail tip lysozyme [Ensifer adhaerens]|uniref:phage tail tip lysozyme n=1 Tax=Ensifer adhaerens TaxID=106592 RepID=UPI003CFBF5A7
MAINDNARYAYNYYQKKYNLTPAQAAGIVGNLVQESGLNTGAINRGDGRDGSDSIGVAQWNGARARGLHSYAKDNGREASNLDTQLDYVMHELQNGEKSAYNRLMASKDVAGATQAFIGFERPQGWSADNPTGGHGYGNRLKFAGQLFGMTPEEIAAATPTSNAVAMAKPGTQAAAQAAVNVASDTSTAPADTKEKEGLFGLKLPEKIFGVDTKKGLNVLGSMNTAMAEQAQQMNQSIAAAGQAAQGRRGSAAPVQIVAQSTPMFGGNPGGAPVEPAEIELLKKKMMMSRRGGLGGLGGFGRA